MKNKLIIIPAIIAGGFFATVGIYGVVNAGRFYPNTYINEKNVSGQQVEEVKNELFNRVISIKKGEGDFIELDLNKIDYKASADIEEPNPLGYIFNFAGEHRIALETDFDEEKLKSYIEETFNSGEDPENAYITFNGKVFDIIPEKEGENYDVDKVYEIIAKGIKDGSFETDISSAKKVPEIKKEDIDVKELNALATNTLALDFDNVIEKRDVGDLLLFKDGNVDIDENALEEYLQKMALKYNTLETKRKFQTTDKGEIEVGGSGIDTFGYKLDIEETIPIVKEAILKKTTEPVQVVFSEKGNNRDKNDIGNTYVEIDISRQHMWYYINGELFIDTDVRTGTESSAQWTPTTEGVFKVLWKQTDKWFLQVGEPCHSDYWMPFNSRGEGIHDATWYSTYGGNYYKWSGSHGCINTPYNVVQKMYEKMEEGTPVIIYRS